MKLSFSLLFLFHFAAYAGDSCVPVYDYHLTPPFTTDIQPEWGLSRVLVGKLNEKAVGGHCYTLNPVQRPELNAGLVQHRLEGIVLWAYPRWFDETRKDLLATDALLWDSSVFISNTRGGATTVVFRYYQPSDLKGLKVGVTAGYSFPELQEEGAVRVDFSSEMEKLNAVAKNLVTTAIFDRSVFLYLSPPSGKRMHESEIPLYRFSRHLLVTPHYAALVPELNAAIAQIRQDKKWLYTLDRFHLRPVSIEPPP